MNAKNLFVIPVKMFVHGDGSTDDGFGCHPKYYTPETQPNKSNPRPMLMLKLLNVYGEDDGAEDE